MALKTRIIPTILYRGDGALKGRRFTKHVVVGSIQNIVKVYSAREVDELIICDIGASPEGRGPDFKRIERIAKHCYMPLTVGGGISTVEHIRDAMLAGADKVCIGTAAALDPELISRAAKRFGSQAITVAVDFVKADPVVTQSAEPRLLIRCGAEPLIGLGCVEFAKRCSDLGAGELLLTSVSRDGLMCGYDLEVIAAVAAAVRIPVVANGGAGCVSHLADGLRAGAHAVAGGAIWHWSQLTPAGAAEALDGLGFPTRRDKSIHPARAA